MYPCPSRELGEAAHFNENTVPAALKKLNRCFCACVSEDVDLLEDVDGLRFSSTEGRADESALVEGDDFLDAAYRMASWSWGSEPSNSRRVILGTSRPSILFVLEMVGGDGLFVKEDEEDD